MWSALILSHGCRPSSQNQCLAPVQSQASSAAYQASRYSGFTDSHLSKEAFYSIQPQHQHSAHHSSNSVKCSMTSYGPSARTASAYSSGSDPVEAEQGLDPQILESPDAFGFVTGGCQGQTYTVTGNSGKWTINHQKETWICCSHSLYKNLRFCLTFDMFFVQCQNNWKLFKKKLILAFDVHFFQTCETWHVTHTLTI